MDKQTLSKEVLDAAECGKVVLTGTAPDSPDGLHMTGSGQELRWVVVKGFNDDWTLYVRYAHDSEVFVAHHGDKAHGKENILNVLDIQDGLLSQYRH